MKFWLNVEFKHFYHIYLYLKFNLKLRFYKISFDRDIIIIDNTIFLIIALILSTKFKGHKVIFYILANSIMDILNERIDTFNPVYNISKSRSKIINTGLVLIKIKRI